MKKTVTILLLLSVMLSLSATTYYVGADGGMTATMVVAGEGYRDYKYSVGLGYKASVPVVIMFDKHLGLDTGISLYGKYYKSAQSIKSGSTSQDNFVLDVKNGFLEFPIALRAILPIGSSIDAYFSLGGYVGWWLYGVRSGSVMNMNDEKESVSEMTDLSYYNRLDAGISTKIGCGYSFDSFRLYGENEFAFSLTDMNKAQKYGAFPIHNITYSVTLGLLWRIDK